ncbi:MAG: hypothetical protein Q8M26_14515 [Pseudolabrys sp.]|nr:hypothetical protein [Pseudolabrys sp.]
MTHDNPDTHPTDPTKNSPLGEPALSPAGDDASTIAGGARPGDGEMADEQGQSRPKHKRPARAKSKRKKQAQPSANEPESVAARILRPLELPAVALDRRLLPAPLIEALEAADLGDKAHLPAGVFMSLATIGAIIGSNLQVEAASELRSPANFALRIVAVATKDGPPLMPPAILAGAHAVEADWIDAHAAAVEQNVSLRRAAEQRRRMYETTRRSAAALGIDPPPFPPDVISPVIGPRPQFVVEHGASRAIQAAASGGTGLFVINDDHMASFDHVGGYYDRATDRLLNTAAAGHLIAIKDSKRGCVVMRPVTASVVGILALSECSGLHAVGTSQLAATLFVAASTPPVAKDCAPFVALMRAVAAIPPGGRLTVTASKEALVAFKAWRDLAEAAERPLSDFLFQLEDLAMRLAATLHIVSIAGSTSMTVHDIPPATLGRAIAIIDSYVVPIARALLGTISHGAAERDARRIVAYARETTSLANPVLDRRGLLRAWQRSIDVPELDAALALLVREDLLAVLDPADAGGGGQRFSVAPTVFEGA